MDSLTIRRATAADRPRLYRIWRAAVEASHQFLAAADLADIDAAVRREYFPSADFIVAVDGDDRPLGFIEVEERATIGGLFVDPASHGRGIARALVDRTMPAGVAWQVEVSEQNAPARRIYEHWGFRAIGRRETDSQGRPYPLLTMRRRADSRAGRVSAPRVKPAA